MKPYQLIIPLENIGDISQPCRAYQRLRKLYGIYQREHHKLRTFHREFSYGLPTQNEDKKI